MRRILLVCASLATITSWAAGCKAPEPEEEEDPSPLSITLTPVDPTIEVGDAQQLTVMGLFPDETTGDVTTLANFTTATSAIATVSESGLVTAVSLGTVTITATYDFRTDTTLVTVVPAVFQEIEPNEDFSEAGLMGNEQTFEGQCSDVDLVDFYSAVVNSGSLTVSLAWDEGAAMDQDLDLSIYDSTPTLLIDDVSLPPDDSPAVLTTSLGSATTVFFAVDCDLTGPADYVGTVTRP